MLESKSSKLMDAITPREELAYVYPLLIINVINELSRLAYEPLFYRSSRFDSVLAWAFILAVIVGLFRSIRASKQR